MHGFRGFSYTCLLIVLVAGSPINPQVWADPAESSGQPKKQLDLEPIGPTLIRFYTGNLSVGNFMSYYGVEANDEGGMNDEIVATMKRCSYSVMCDYVAWPIVERQEGKWDFSFHIANAKMLDENGLGYNIFSWLHFPPKWYEEGGKFVPYVNVETGNSIPQMSLWSPDLPNVFGNYYRELGKALGEHIDFVRIAMPTEYGEIGYCAGYTKWLRPQEFAEPAYWCGDEYAKADFRKAMMKRYGSIEKINEAWKADFKTADDIAMPDTVNAPGDFTSSKFARRQWVDFIDWYNQAWADCLAEVTGIIAKYFPGKELIGSLGYGWEKPEYGNDQGRHIEAMKKLGLSCQSPGDIGYFPTRRVSSACRHYKVPYYTEPPDSVSADRELNRIFMDISNGVETWFDYLPNTDGARHHFRAYKKHITGQPPRSNVAVWHPTLDHWLHPDQFWSKPIYDIADQLRDMMAYEIVDDRMISSGALDTLNVKQLILGGADWLDSKAWTNVHNWVEAGGVLVVLSDKPIADIDGATSLWERQVVETVPVVINPVCEHITGEGVAHASPDRREGKRFPAHGKSFSPCGGETTLHHLKAGTKMMGKGKILTVNTVGLTKEQRAVIAGRLCFEAGSQVGHPENNTKLVDGKIDGILSTRFDDKILYFNTGTENKKLDLAYRESDFPEGSPRPAKMKQSLEIPARTIIDIPLN